MHLGSNYPHNYAACSFISMNAQPCQSQKHFTNNPLYTQLKYTCVLLFTIDIKVKHKNKNAYVDLHKF